MWCGVLGPLIVRGSAGEPLIISGPARRLLFAALVSRAGRTVAPDVLVEDLWGHVPPRTAAKTLQSHVVRLRDDLGRDAALVTDRAGYRLDVAAEDVDAGSFAAGVERAAACSAAGDPAGALRELDAALLRWRGDAYEEFADAPFCVAERLRLFELRAHAEEERTEAALRLGQAGELVAELEKRLAAAPFRERTWEQLVLALYRDGRQADALAAYGRARATLAEELGVDPGPRLQRLEQQVLRQDPVLLAAPGAPRPGPPRRVRRAGCPYRGLASYREGDGELFVGRERLTAELVGMLADNHVLAVVGASGTGKSSLLRAGLVPALRGGALPGSAAWRVSVLTPADALGESAIGAADVVVLDQAEDLFQLEPVARADLVDRFAQLAGGGGRLVFALRADFYGRLTEVQPLAAYAQLATVLVGPLREDELRRVVVEPAERVGLQIEPALVDAVLDDVAGQPAALPLLSAALVRTWENRAGDRLTLDGYRRGGGVASALEATAEDAYQRLSEPHRVLARRLLVRLAVREGSSWVRRPMRRVDAAADADARDVLAALAGARLVSVGQERVEITHDALLAHWPRLCSWLDERALAAELLDHLEVASRAWAEADRPDSDLYRGPRLQTALDWRSAHPDDIAEIESEFLDRSAVAADAELSAAREQVRREAHGRRRLRAVAAGLAVMVVLATVGIVIALHERSSSARSASRARAAALSADARRLAALSANAPDIATSSLLAVAAYRLQDSADTRGALLDAVERSQSALWRIPATHRLQWVAADPAGDRVATIDNRGRVFVYDPRTRRTVASFASHSQLLAGISADGRQVVVSGGDPAVPNDPNRVSVLDVASGRRLHVFATDADLNTWQPVMSQDGRWVAMITTRHIGAGVAVDVYDMRDWAAPARTVVVPAGPTGIAVSRDALALQAADGTVTVRSLPSLRVLGQVITARPPNHAAPMALTPDGGAIAAVNGANPTESAVYFTHSAKVVPLPAQPEGIETLGFSPDGADLAIGSIVGSLNSYRASDGVQLASYAGDVGTVMAVSWSGTTRPTGLYTAGLDSQLASWAIRAGPQLLTQRGPELEAPDRSELFGHIALGLTPQFSSPAQERGYAVDVRTGRFETFPLHLGADGVLNQAVASADGRRALLSIEDGAGHNRVVIWDLIANREIGQLQLPSDAPRVFEPGMNAAISPNGAIAYCNLTATRVGVFDLPSGRYVRSYSIRFAGRDAARVVTVPWQFDPNGNLLVGGGDTGPHPDGGGIGPDDTAPPNQRLGLVDVRTGRLIAQTGLGDVTAPSAVAWSPDHTLLAVGTFDGSLSLYGARTLHEVVTAGTAQAGYVRTLSFAPTSRDIVVGGTDDTLTFWSVPDLSREGMPVIMPTGPVSGPLFAWYTPSGGVVGLAPDELRTGSDLERWFTFDAAPADLVRTACALAGGDMTRAQWTRYVADRPYQRVCS